MFFDMSARDHKRELEQCEEEQPKKTHRRISAKMSVDDIEARDQVVNNSLLDQHLDTVYFGINSSDGEMMSEGEQASSSQLAVQEPQAKEQSEQEWSLGGRSIHRTHRPGFTKGVTHCWRCGAWCVGIPTSLVAPCKAPTRAGSETVARMSRGDTPHPAVKTWPEPEATAPHTVFPKPVRREAPTEG